MEEAQSTVADNSIQKKKKFVLIKKKRDHQEILVPVVDEIVVKEKPPLNIMAKEDIMQLVTLSFIERDAKTITSSDLGASVRLLAKRLWIKKWGRNPKDLPDRLLQALKNSLDGRGFHFIHPKTESLLFVNYAQTAANKGNTWSVTQIVGDDENVEKISLTKEMISLLDDDYDEDIAQNVAPLARLPQQACQDLCDYFLVNIQPLILTDSRDAFLKRLTGILNDGLRKIQFPPNTQGRAPPISVKFFGSSVNNLGFCDSDADLCIVLKDSKAIVQNHPYQNMFKITKVLWKHYSNIQTIASARVPIVKFYDHSTKLDCDINFNHSLGIENSALLSSYTHLDERVQPLIMMIKYFVKCKNINDASKDSISSYAYTLMAIAYLQHRGILGNLQEDYSGPRKITSVPEINFSKKRGGNQKKRGAPIGQRLVDVSFKYIERPQDPQKQANWFGDEGVANLFIGFLDYFANKHIYRPQNVISVKSGGFVIQPAIDNKLLNVLDPFEEDRSTTRMVDSASLKRIKKEFQQAIRLLQSGRVKQVFKVVSS